MTDPTDAMPMAPKPVSGAQLSATGDNSASKNGAQLSANGTSETEDGGVLHLKSLAVGNLLRAHRFSVHEWCLWG